MLEQLKAKLGFEDTPEPTPVAAVEEPISRDIAIAGAFIGAIALLLVVAGYVINRISSDRAHSKKWQEYDDCGWA